MKTKSAHLSVSLFEDPNTPLSAQKPRRSKWHETLRVPSHLELFSSEFRVNTINLDIEEINKIGASTVKQVHSTLDISVDLPPLSVDFCDDRHQTALSPEKQTIISSSSIELKSRDDKGIIDGAEVRYFGSPAKLQFYKTYEELAQQERLFVKGFTEVSSELVNSPDKMHILKRTELALHKRLSIEDSKQSMYLENYVVMSPNSKSPSRSSKSLSSRVSNDLLKSPSLPKIVSSFPSIDVSSSYRPNSPRAVFLVECMKDKLPPSAMAMIRNSLTTELNLSHLGLGDQVVGNLAKAISSLPFLEKLNLCDNRLTDFSLFELINSIANSSSIQHMDISDNRVSVKTTKALNNIISKPICSLRSLCISNAGISDSSCRHLLESLKENKTLETLDLSKNSLGMEELVGSNKHTSGYFLAELLSKDTCPLKNLDVSFCCIS